MPKSESLYNFVLQRRRIGVDDYIFFFLGHVWSPVNAVVEECKGVYPLFLSILQIIIKFALVKQFENQAI